MNNKKLMPPMWMAYPDINRFSIGWRWGSGESYRYKFWDWFDTLSEKEQQKYITQFPEPKRWYKFWEMSLNEDYDYGSDEENMCFVNDGLFVNYWQKDGKPEFDLEWLKKQYNSGEKIKFEFFWGHRPSHDKTVTKSCLSQWWKCEFYEDAEKYCCMEQYMMSAKAKLFGDDEINQQIMKCSDPNKIKSLGRKVRGFDGKIWDKVKYSIVLNGNYLKFSQNRQLMNFLLNTGDKILVEASPYDGIWGIQMSANDENAKNPLEWRGSNLLGFALTEVREELKRVYKNENLVDYKFVKE